MLWVIRHIVFAALCFGWMLQAGSIFAQTRIAQSRVEGGSSPTMLPAALSDIAFIPNRGQLADQFGKPMPEVLYTLDGHGVKFYFTKNSMHYVFSRVEHALACAKDRGKLKQCGEGATLHAWQEAPSPPDSCSKLSLYRVDAHFLGANPDVIISAEEPASNYTNYYLPQCPDGITHVPAFHKIVYHDLYPHIDMVVTSVDKSDQYDFIVHPGGNPSQIRVEYDGQDSLVLNGKGNLRVTSPFGEVTELAPASYQEERNIPSRYILRSNILSYKIGAYDHARDLTIDPPRLWGTYFGGPAWDEAFSVGVDRHNNVDVAGITSSATGIATTGAYQVSISNSSYDAFIASFGPNGNLRWATYYGGNIEDELLSLACDSSCDVVAAGWTESTTGVASPGAFESTKPEPGNNESALLVDFDSIGLRRWATYFGGSWRDVGAAVAVDSAGNIILVGTSIASGGLATSGAFQPTNNNGATNGFLAKFTPLGSLLWATYYGGTASDYGEAVSCDQANNIYLSLSTTSLGLATPGAWETKADGALIAKFLPGGMRDWATYYPSYTIYGFQYPLLAASRTGNLYVAGISTYPGLATSGAYQTVLGGQTDGFITRFDSSGKRIWSTYYGGPDDDIPLGIAADTDENVIFCGYTTSDSGIATSGEYQTTNPGGANDAPFFAKLDSACNLRWGTYYGDYGYADGVSIDRDNHPALVGSAWAHVGQTLFASPGAYQVSYAGGGLDAFVARFCDTLEIAVTATPSTHGICPGTPLRLTAGPGLAAYQWNLNGTPIPGATSTTYTVPGTLKTGIYTYQVTGAPANSNVCAAASYPFTVIVGGAIISFAKQPSFCQGNSVRLFDTVTGIGTLHYAWTPTAGLDHPDSAEPIATPTTTTTYTLTVTDTAGCASSKSITLTVHSPPVVTLPTSTSLCAGSSVTISATTSGGQGPFTYSWNPATGLNRTDTTEVTASPAKSSVYTFRITDANGCSDSASVLVQVNPVPKVSAGPARSICPGGSIKIGGIATGGIIPYTYTWAPSTGLSDPTIAQPIASPAVTTLYIITVTDKNGCMAMDSVRVTVADSLTPTITANGALSFCMGDSVGLDAGTGYATYAWSSGEKTSAIAVTKTGDYFVHVTNASGCAGTSAALHVTVLADSVPRPMLSANSTTICEGDSIQLGLSGQYSTYRWSTGDSSSSIFVSKSGNYSVTVTNAAGCTGTSAPMTFTVVPKPTVQITASGPTTFCAGDSVELSATSGYSYRWSVDGVAQVDSSASILAKSSGTYQVFASNSAGCTASSAPLSITVHPAPNPSITGPASVCPNSTTTYNVANHPGDSYTWSLVPAGAGTIVNSALASSSIQWGAAGTATLFLTEFAPDGCSVFTTLPISIASNLAPLVNGPSAMCAGDSITLDVPGSGYASYKWSRDGNPIAGAASDSITIGHAGNYTVFVTSAGGCSGTSAAVNVTVYPVSPQPVITRIGAELRSTLAAHYQWSYGDSILTDSITQTIAPDTDGNYTVTITDSNGCSNTSDPFNFSNAAWASVSLPPNTIGAPGDTISIPVTLDSSQNLLEAGATNYAASIGLDPTMLAPIRPPGVRVGTQWVVSLSGMTPTKPGVLQTITALALDSGYCSDITIDTFYFPGANVTVAEQSGSFCLNTPCTPVLISSDTAFTIKRISPNPGPGEFWIEYHVAAEGPLSMELEDYLGRMVTVLKQGWCKPGDETETYSVQNISSGLYRLVLRSGARELSRLLVISK